MTSARAKDRVWSSHFRFRPPRHRRSILGCTLRSLTYPAGFWLDVTHPFIVASSTSAFRWRTFLDYHFLPHAHALWNRRVPSALRSRYALITPPKYTYSTVCFCSWPAASKLNNTFTPSLQAHVLRLGLRDGKPEDVVASKTSVSARAFAGHAQLRCGKYVERQWREYTTLPKTLPHVEHIRALAIAQPHACLHARMPFWKWRMTAGTLGDVPKRETTVHRRVRPTESCRRQWCGR